VGQDLGIEGIGFGQLAGRPRNIKDLSWIHHDNREDVGGEVAPRGISRPPVDSSTMSTGATRPGSPSCRTPVERWGSLAFVFVIRT